MNLQTAIASIHAPQSANAILQAIMNGDMSAVRFTDTRYIKSKQEVEHRVSFLEKEIQESKSDLMYWQILAELEYYRSVSKMFEAAELVGDDNLPDVPAPDLSCCIMMEAIDKIGKFGTEILEKAKAQCQK